MKLTGGEIVVEMLIRHHVPFAFGIPGHGCLALADAFVGREERIKLLGVKQEMSGGHAADAYYRVTGQPLCMFTSIGPGALNTAIAAATAFVDSRALLIITGSAHTHMRGKGLLQEVERTQDDDLAQALRPLVKRSFRVSNVALLASTVKRAFQTMLSGRPGPVHIELPMDIQAQTIEVELPEPYVPGTGGISPGDPQLVARAAEMLATAQRPVILAGGGVHIARAYDELAELAHASGAAVVTTMAGKGCFDETDPLYGWHTGSKGTRVGLELTSKADVLLAVGCRFADETSSSYRHGVSFSIPGTKLIQVDLDPAEIGKNYPVDVGILGDMRGVLPAISAKLEGRTIDRSDFHAHVAKLRTQWLDYVRTLVERELEPPTISRLLSELRQALADDAFVVTSSGNTQAQMLQEFPFSVPGTCLTTGGFSAMGWTLPAAIGAKLARPERQVVALLGDGDFLMTMQEMATAIELGTNVVVVLANNRGWLAISDLQMDAFGLERASGTLFTTPDGQRYTPDFAACAQAFGWHSERVARGDQIADAIGRALDAGKPALVEVMVSEQYPYTGSPAVGWWDVPIPEYLGAEKRQAYEQGKKEEKL
ncbi:MAG: thiamine pyrophosphate-binding protein [Candidatus Alcyoniella australis]|nr:thiamine pyrophosphate-binding protein [Candidatus Alcyoniella australis]